MQITFLVDFINTCINYLLQLVYFITTDKLWSIYIVLCGKIYRIYVAFYWYKYTFRYIHIIIYL